MIQDFADTPKAHFDRYLDEVEREPEFQARRERIARIQGNVQKTQGSRTRPLHPYRGAPAIGVPLVIGLVVLAVVMRWVGAP